MRVISQREFRDSSAAVMDAVEAGETYVITRNGVEVAEIRPITRRRRLSAEELVARTDIAGCGHRGVRAAPVRR
ncbi:prevent-host-death family protein [Crossiella equi]|uniref:Antitoxin n=1 Tax=Crossiella equi TaxID=130796 RepID=A0ABS5AP60_9PSEU|nr:type II toxin-antitoxin system prevent-host-death family antitoxin [Crossiella equi]MBP2478351.1 prevent-host-death family protein [Crossiella equi]